MMILVRIIIITTTTTTATITTTITWPLLQGEIIKIDRISRDDTLQWDDKDFWGIWIAKTRIL